MAAVLTLDETPPRAESCSFWASLGTLEVPADEGDTPGREGLDSADMGDRKRTAVRHSGRVGSSAPHALPPIRYHARFRAPNDDVWQQIRAGEAATVLPQPLAPHAWGVAAEFVWLFLKRLFHL